MIVVILSGFEDTVKTPRGRHAAFCPVLKLCVESGVVPCLLQLRGMTEVHHGSEQRAIQCHRLLLFLLHEGNIPNQSQSHHRR